jgi:hypothetical protein
VAGAELTVTFTDMPANASAWIAIAAESDADTTDLQWAYTGGMTTGTKVFANIPAGAFVARGYADGGFTKDAQSPAVVVGTAAPSP